MTLPPYAHLLGITVEPGETAPTLVMPFGDDVLGRPGFPHGGAIAGLLEMAALAALDQALGRAGRPKPITATVDFLAGGRDKPTRATGTVTRLGTRIANVEAVATQDGRPIAAARMTCLIDRR